MDYRIGIVIFVSLFSAVPVLTQQDGKAQAESLYPYERMLASDQEQDLDRTNKIAVWRQYVRSEKRQQFESVLRQVRRIGAAALSEGQMSPLEARTYQSLRVLPYSASDHGALVYLFVADPYIPDGDYSVETFLRMCDTPELADSLYRAYEETLARPRSSPSFTPTDSDPK